MCGKLTDSELGSIKALMSISLNTIVAEAFGLEPEAVAPDQRFGDDLRMTARQRVAIQRRVAEYFDGARPTISRTTTLADLAAAVIDPQFADVAFHHA